MYQYSILVKQYSLSKNEYDFWKNLKKINDSGGDIFALQPFPVSGNIHNLNDPKEKVLGYFRVSAVKQKRMNISFNEIARLKLPIYYNTTCERIEQSPSSTFDQLYALYCINSDYSFVEPLYNPDTGQLKSLVFARPECADCELSGSSTKPDFWPEEDK
jgi:ABC-type cobalt transport system substrate-binding protein